jgi:lipoprotein-anchoring transpeptidase ErfK/SrfK
MSRIWFAIDLTVVHYALKHRVMNLALLAGLIWLTTVLTGSETTAFAHNEASAYEETLPQSTGVESTALPNAEVPPTPNNTSPAPPAEPTEWIAAWVDDLKQSNERWIQVDLSAQQLIAWEGNTSVFSAPVSTGREGDWTPPGVYAVETKYDKAWMQGDDYDIPNVPYVMYFFGSYAIHGAYWRDSFGTPASRGCVSMEVDRAAWLFSWASEGTHVVVQQ